ncbi:hypothetical protein ElyMa_003019300 [Elysia marginata]|uniref:Uncharacterized protein n=1 Tax=Elysia marginata TaxID=1093978 RepID=A0AAV4IIW5_9GAST|nr:hypothetical protein ElyMa_003019300 [Elysia marginata]
MWKQNKNPDHRTRAGPDIFRMENVPCETGFTRHGCSTPRLAMRNCSYQHLKCWTSPPLDLVSSYQHDEWPGPVIEQRHLHNQLTPIMFAELNSTHFDYSIPLGYTLRFSRRRSFGPCRE